MTAPANQSDALVAFLRARYDELEWSVEDDVLPTPQADRVLADLDSKRRILDLIASTELDPSDPSDRAHRTDLDAVLRLLAAPFAGHPDYREEWAIQRD